MKFAKVFSLESFPLDGITSIVSFEKIRKGENSIQTRVVRIVTKVKGRHYFFVIIKIIIELNNYTTIKWECFYFYELVKNIISRRKLSWIGCSHWLIYSYCGEPLQLACEAVCRTSSILLSSVA